MTPAEIVGFVLDFIQGQFNQMNYGPFDITLPSDMAAKLDEPYYTNEVSIIVQEKVPTLRARILQIQGVRSVR